LVGIEILCEEVIPVTLRFSVERESETGLLGPITRPCEGAWEGAYLDSSLRAKIGWFITFDEVPTEVGGYSVRLSGVTEEGVAGHLMILDGS
jgi:hypothetical protein